MVAHASLKVYLADSDAIGRLLEATLELVDALEIELAEPFAMSPLTQDRLQTKLAEFKATSADVLD